MGDDRQQTTTVPSVVIEPIYAVRCAGCGYGDTGTHAAVTKWAAKHRCEDPR